MEHSEEILTAQRMSLKILQLYIKISKAFKLLEKLINGHISHYVKNVILVKFAISDVHFLMYLIMITHNMDSINKIGSFWM